MTFNDTQGIAVGQKYEFKGLVEEVESIDFLSHIVQHGRKLSNYNELAVTFVKVAGGFGQINLSNLATSVRHGFINQV